MFCFTFVNLQIFSKSISKQLLCLTLKTMVSRVDVFILFILIFAGKDVVFVVTKDDHDSGFKDEAVKNLFTTIADDLENDVGGALLPDGRINFACPCLGSQVAGPCGYEFRQLFSCFHENKMAEQRGEKRTGMKLLEGIYGIYRVRR